jgi:hypothetical protein
LAEVLPLIPEMRRTAYRPLPSFTDYIKLSFVNDSFQRLRTSAPAPYRTFWFLTAVIHCLTGLLFRTCVSEIDNWLPTMETGSDESKKSIPVYT